MLSLDHGFLQSNCSPQNALDDFLSDSNENCGSVCQLTASSLYNGSLGIGVEVPRFWGVSGVYTPLTPQNLALTTANPKEPKLFSVYLSGNSVNLRVPLLT